MDHEERGNKGFEWVSESGVGVLRFEGPSKPHRQKVCGPPCADSLGRAGQHGFGTLPFCIPDIPLLGPHTLIQFLTTAAWSP